ncbi:MAG: hypothetical protein JST38_03270 [Bacteroidetes bacterium]|nr:hypothetical protein [Bacteroidota bacterium]
MQKTKLHRNKAVRSFTLDPQLYRTLQAIAKAENRSMSNAVETGLRWFLKNRG